MVSFVCWGLYYFTAQFRLALALPVAAFAGIGAFFAVKSRTVEGQSVYCSKHTCTQKGCTKMKKSTVAFCAGDLCDTVVSGLAQVKVDPAADKLCLYTRSTNGQACRSALTAPPSVMLKATCISTAALFYFLLYPTITVNSVQILAECHTICTDIEETDCTSYMRSDYSINCDTGTHAAYQAAAGMVFALIAVGTPLLLARTLWARRAEFLGQAQDSLYYDPLRTPSALTLGFGFFFKPFKSSLLHWEAVGLLYKLSLTAVITFIAPGTALQVYTGICFAGAFWVLDAVFQPFENVAENALQSLAQGVIFLTLAIGGMLQTSEGEDVAYKTAAVDRDAVTVVLVLINSAVLLSCAILFWLNRPRNMLQVLDRLSPRTQLAVRSMSSSFGIEIDADSDQDANEAGGGAPGGYLTIDASASAAVPQSSHAAEKTKKTKKTKTKTKTKTKNGHNDSEDDEDDDDAGFGFGGEDNEGM